MTPTGHPRSTLHSPDRAPATPPPESLPPRHRRVLEAIRRRPMTAGEILNMVLGSQVTAAAWDDLLADLVGRGLAEAFEGKDERHGARFTFYRATDRGDDHAGRDR